MSFEKLIHKVDQAEAALEAEERRVAADIRQLKASWRAAWTPGRIVVAGLVSGYMTGRAEPLHSAARNGGVLRIVTLLSGLFAGTAAQAAAEDAQEAADSAGRAADATEDAVHPGGPVSTRVPSGTYAAAE
ncbi:MAG: hypothetical protein H0W24_02595 [Lysobacter sp.]|nr:hypothetical protein [Lysobacter sp.]MDQ3205301.1 hypothetical protein [Pseudomonadota bacterium]